ncbi:hypothetical protein HBB16_17425 [Pseudonocardia sp. MCCB 268]|nr:hypothetical protein [Pseudonocardia cytotoxica]
MACFRSGAAARPLGRAPDGGDPEQRRCRRWCSAVPRTGRTCSSWSTLAGERDERVTTTDLHGQVASAPCARCRSSPGTDREPPGRTGRLLIRRGLAPVVRKRVRMAWARRDVERPRNGSPGSTWSPPAQRTA